MSPDSLNSPIVFTFHYVYIYIFCVRSSRKAPLHLHSTMFIFILDSYEELNETAAFTFHYVYIYMQLTEDDRSLVKAFTFHYVYIYIVRQFKAAALKMYLHSTMFIFICLRFCDRVHVVSIYIPLCLYLYL